MLWLQNFYQPTKHPCLWQQYYQAFGYKILIAKRSSVHRWSHFKKTMACGMLMVLHQKCADHPTMHHNLAVRSLSNKPAPTLEIFWHQCWTYPRKVCKSSLSQWDQHYWTKCPLVYENFHLVAVEHKFDYFAIWLMLQDMSYFYESRIKAQNEQNNV